ncbi:MAG: hypothetical protein JXR51_05845 [Bacteroidales bacterium]|nr:hypothetical protein [Bacteroidales bacterium]MBN2756683.1 hypothetical protein [Bacteroidales bacterium]
MPKFKVNTKSGKSFYLKDENEIQRGGEGRILLLDNEPNMVVKIYHQTNHAISEDKFNYLQKLDSKFFIKPLELIFIDNEIVGYKMEYAGNEYFPISSLFSKNFCTKNKIDFKTKKKIATQLTKAIEKAHNQDVIIGDLNQFNILTNIKGEIKLIDTDSYETPFHKHNGLLLDDIRDYLYNGFISKNSDYFALSVILFYLFTYTHPFKGIHKKIKKLSDRMINKIPIFKKDSDIIIPKCYEAIQNNQLQQNFEKLYFNGERFLIPLHIIDKKIKSSNIKSKIISNKVEENDVIISPIEISEQIVNVYFNNEIGFIETETKFVIYSAKNRAYLSRKHVINKNVCENVFIGSKNIVLKKKNKLFYIDDKSNIIEITNFIFTDNSKISQKENILIVISNNQMTWLYIDEILNTSIKSKRTEVFGQAFNINNGLIQNSGGVQRIFYNTGKDIATVKTQKNIKQIFQNKNTGIAQIIDNKIVMNFYFKINGLNIEFNLQPSEQFNEFAFMESANQNGYIFEASDNKIKVIRTQDFQIVSEISSKYISEQTSLFYTKSGIIAWENDTVLLINSKEKK